MKWLAPTPCRYFRSIRIISHEAHICHARDFALTHIHKKSATGMLGLAWFGTAMLSTLINIIKVNSLFSFCLNTLIAGTTGSNSTSSNSTSLYWLVHLSQKVYNNATIKQQVKPRDTASIVIILSNVLARVCFNGDTRQSARAEWRPNMRSC